MPCQVPATGHSQLVRGRCWLTARAIPNSIPESFPASLSRRVEAGCDVKGAADLFALETFT